MMLLAARCMRFSFPRIQAALRHGLPSQNTTILSSTHKAISCHQGSWRAIAQQTANFRRAGPDALLQEAAWQVLALVKLRNFAAAAEELAALGDLDSPDYVADTPEGVRKKQYHMH